jgi:hypothetical protein
MLLATVLVLRRGETLEDRTGDIIELSLPDAIAGMSRERFERLRFVFADWQDPMIEAGLIKRRDMGETRPRIFDPYRGRTASGLAVRSLKYLDVLSLPDPLKRMALSDSIACPVVTWDVVQPLIGTRTF